MSSLAASALFYLKTVQAVRYTDYAMTQLDAAGAKIADLQGKLGALEKAQGGYGDELGMPTACSAEPISGNKDGDARLVCQNADGSSVTVDQSIRALLPVKAKDYAPVIAAFLEDPLHVVIITGLERDATAYHVWVHDTDTGETNALLAR